MLTTQYRMVPALSEFPRRIYAGAFVDGDNVMGISRPPRGFTWPRPDFPLCVLHSPHEEVNDASGSLHNPGEAHIVASIVRQMRGAGVPKEDMAVLTGYAGQARAIQALVGESVEVFVLDRFQGQERAVIIFTVVRSNEAGRLGFLSDRRRMNVALTRARRGLIVICNTSTLGQDQRSWKCWLNWAEGHHVVQSAAVHVRAELCD